MSSHVRRHRGFTLTEMLVVIGIIAVLAALLLPAVMRAVTTARNTVIAIEVNQLAQAVEAYRLEKGDYPPNFRDDAVIRKHIAKCYPRIDQKYLTLFMNQVFPPTGQPNAYSRGASNPVIDESEALVFWLSKTDTDPQYPFLSYPVLDPNNGNAVYPAGRAANPKRFFDFDQTRLLKTINLDVESYKAKFSGDTFYIYIDSRSYANPATDVTNLARFSNLDNKDFFAIADDINAGVRPYWTSPPAITGTIPANTAYRAMTSLNIKPANPTTFQIICAGQDGHFGKDEFSKDTDVKIATGSLAGTNFQPGDKDNITNFSGGKLLGDLIP